MLPIPTNPAELAAIRTADQFGYLMPAHVGTPQAERLIAAGYAAWVRELAVSDMAREIRELRASA